jgi:hypothetical protein
MSVIGSNILAGASGQGGAYNLTNSLRFRSSASAYLNRTPSNTATSGTTWTVSYWFKVNVGSSASRRCGFSAGNADATGGSIQFLVTWQGYSQDYKMCIVTGQGTTSITTSGVFRDPSAWYHVVVACDTTQATASNRWKIYVNGVQQAIGGDAFGGSANYPTQNTTFRWNASGQANLIGATDESGTKVFFMDGYIAEFNNIDGQALTSSSFGETNAKTGVWQPKKYAGTYGTNGFYLPFTDNSALTTSSNVGLGKDFSGNGNYWTTNNISITSGVTYDSMTDVPTLTSATAANFCVMNPLAKDSDVTMSNGNLQFDCTSGGLGGAIATFAVSSGKWYWEVVSTAGAGSSIGIAKLPLSAYDANQTGTYLYLQGGDKRLSPSTDSAYGASWTTNDVIGIALDMDAGTVTFYKNNASQGTAFSSLSGEFTAWVQDGSGGSASTIIANFGQRPFAYTPPTGFVALNTFNLPTPTIGATASTQAGKYMSNVLWTGNGASTIDVTGVGFQPDFVWAKRRSAADGHGLFDVVRGTNQWLQSNTTGAETTFGGNFGLLAFNPDGFQMGSGSAVNLSGATYVAWNWKANGTGVTNTAGSITSTVSANTTSGFSVVTYTGNGTGGATVGHGLGVAPSMIILKRRNGTSNWTVGHSSLPSWAYYLVLNITDAQGSNNVVWNSTAPTSTVFTVGTGADQNGSGNTIVAYCFAEVAGYSKFGSYTGNGSSDGPFVYTGFRPKFFMTKRTNGAGDNWHIHDTTRSPYNEAFADLRPNTSDAENTSAYPMDIVSNGIKWRQGGSDGNESGATYIYMAFAENPFKYSLAR